MPWLNHPGDADPSVLFWFGIWLGDPVEEATVVLHHMCHFCFDEDVDGNTAATGVVDHGELQVFDDEASRAVGGTEVAGVDAEFVAGEGVEDDGGDLVC